MIRPQLAEPALVALRDATVRDNTLTLPPGRLPRWVWLQVTAALTLIAGGGRWDRALGVFVFPRPVGGQVTAFLAATQERADEQIDDTATVPAGPLLELAGRLEAASVTTPGWLATDDEMAVHFNCFGSAAAALRATVRRHAILGVPGA